PTPAKRPANSRLNCTKLMRRFDIELPAWKQGVDEVLTKLRIAGN
ncbi:sugar nucleotide-binding protein, partial [Rhizobium sp. P38BS-XIX]